MHGRPDSDLPVNVRLENPVGNRCHQPVADSFPHTRGSHQGAPGGGFPQSASAPQLPANDDHLGWRAIHRSKLVTQYVASTEDRVAIERLPAYAPELNPAEYIWEHLKEHEIGNLLVRESWQLSHHATAALSKMRRGPRIILACSVQVELWPK